MRNLRKKARYRQSNLPSRAQTGQKRTGEEHPAVPEKSQVPTEARVGEAAEQSHRRRNDELVAQKTAKCFPALRDALPDRRKDGRRGQSQEPKRQDQW